MKYYNIWRYFAAMVAFSVIMAVCLFLFIFYQVPLSREIGFGAMVVGLGITVLLVIRLRPLFKGDMSGQGSGFDKTWRSYPKDGEK